MQNQEQTLLQLLSTFDLHENQILGQHYSIEENKLEEDKKLKKKLRKFALEDTDTNDAAIEKVTKMLEEFSKNYEVAAKKIFKIQEQKQKLEKAQKERDAVLSAKQMNLNLHRQFKTKYDDQIKKAQQVEKEEQEKRKTLIEGIQGEIKEVQAKYEQAGKIKIEKYKENQQLKHETMKLQPHLVASESLYEAQLKKKAIEIEIQMTTLKQKIEMFENFRKMKPQTEEKLRSEEEKEVKITRRLQKIQGKENQHKILLAKAHLVFEDYKKAISTLKTTIPKQEREAIDAKTKSFKAESSLKDLRRELDQLEKEIDNQLHQKKGLETLETNLQKQLEA